MTDFYSSLDGAAAYHLARNNTAWAASNDPARTAALIRGSQFVDGAYGGLFRGYRTGLRAQVLAFPRTNCTDAAGYAIPSDAIPIEVEYATYEAALRELAAPGSLAPDLTRAVVRRKVGPIETEFDPKSPQRPRFTAIDMIMAPLLGLGSASSIRVVRA